MGGCITASPLPLFQPNHAGLGCYFLWQGTTLWIHEIRTCANSFQAAVKPQLNCIKHQSEPKIFQSISFRLNSTFCLGNTFSEVNEDIERVSHSISPHLLFYHLLTLLGSAHTLSKEEGFGHGSPSTSAFTSGLQRKHHCVHFCLHFLNRHYVLHIYVWQKELLNPVQISE